MGGNCYLTDMELDVLIQGLDKELNRLGRKGQNGGFGTFYKNLLKKLRRTKRL